MKNNPDIVISGSGMAGSGAAYHLSQNGVKAKMYEMNKHYGGQTSSFTFEGKYVFDNGPHLSFTSDARIRELFADSIEQDFHTIPVKVNNYWNGHWVKHPAIAHMNGLPADVITKCLTDFVNIQNLPTKETYDNYGEWLIATYGETFARWFPMRYGQRYHTCPAEKMNLSWLGNRLYKPKVEEVLNGAINKEAPNVHYVQECRYPKNGGYVSYLNKFKDLAEVHLDHTVSAIDSKNKKLSFTNGTTIDFDQLISTMPLPELIKILDNVPEDVKAAAELLSASTCVLVNIVIDREAISDYHWTYFYDEDFSFTRLSFPHMQAANNVPKGCGSFQAEHYYSKKYRPFNGDLDKAIADTKADLMRCGLLKESDKILFENAWVLDYANVIFDLDEPAASKTVLNYLDQIGILSAGRYGDWGYIWTDQSFASGENAAKKALQLTK